MTQKPEKKNPEKGKPAADERNLVAKRELDKALPPEERIKLWWEKNRAALAAGAILALIVVAGFQGLRLYRQAHDNRVQQAWTAIENAADRLAFAEENAGHPLAGLAWLQLADEQYRGDNFAQARDYYRNAVEALSEPVFLGRARLGSAMATAKAGDRESAKTQLETLARDPRGFHAIRAEAAYHRAILAIEERNAEEVERYFDLLTTLRYAEGWLSRLQEARAQTRI